MKHYPCVLTIAGSDCSGGAGIPADIKTISALGAYAASAITAITVQNTCGVTDIHPVPASYVKGQIEAVMTDIRPRAIKIGMINDVNIVKVIAESLQKFKPEFVVSIQSWYRPADASSWKTRQLKPSPPSLCHCLPSLLPTCVRPRY